MNLDVKQKFCERVSVSVGCQDLEEFTSLGFR